MSVLRFKRSSWGVVQCCDADMDPSILDDSGHNDILGSEDGLNVEATIDEHLEETGFDLDSNHWPVPRQSGPEVDTVAPSPVVGQSSTFNFEN